MFAALLTKEVQPLKSCWIWVSLKICYKNKHNGDHLHWSHSWVNFFFPGFLTSTLLHYNAASYCAVLSSSPSSFLCRCSHVSYPCLCVGYFSQLCICPSLPSSPGAPPWLHIHSGRWQGVSQVAVLISWPSVLCRWFFYFFIFFSQSVAPHNKFTLLTHNDECNLFPIEPGIITPSLC